MKFSNSKKRKFIAASISIILAVSLLIPTASASALRKKDACHQASGWIGWLFCPILNVVVEGLNSVYESVEKNFLQVRATEMFGDDLRAVWAVVRDISNTSFVVIFMIIVISQLTGYGIDNYGIKRMLPRLIVVAILVNLSFIIMQIFVDISNIAGASVKGILSNIGSSIGTETVGDAGTADYILFGGLAIGGGILFSGGMVFLVILILLYALLSYVFLWGLLIVCQVGIIAVAVLAPLAFICYVFPNTEDLFKKWFDMTKKLLVIYPLCSLVVGASQLAAKIFFKLSDSIGWTMIIAGIVAMVVGFIMLPNLLKSSLAAMGKIGAKISDLHTAGARASVRLAGATSTPARLAQRARRATIGSAIRPSRSATGESATGKTRFGRRIGAAGLAILKTPLGATTQTLSYAKDMTASSLAKRRLAMQTQVDRTRNLANPETVNFYQRNYEAKRREEQVKMNFEAMANQPKGANGNELRRAIEEGGAGAVERMIGAMRALDNQSGKDTKLSTLDSLNMDRFNERDRNGRLTESARDYRAAFVNELSRGSFIEREYGKHLSNVGEGEDFGNLNRFSSTRLAGRISEKKGDEALIGFDKDELEYLNNNPATLMNLSSNAIARGISSSRSGEMVAQFQNMIHNIRTQPGGDDQIDQIIQSISSEQFAVMSDSLRQALLVRSDGSSRDATTSFASQISSLRSNPVVASRMSVEERIRYGIDQSNETFEGGTGI